MLLVTPAFSTRLSPCCWRHSLPPFLLPMGHRTLIGRPHLFWRFPYCSQENFRRKLMERQKRGLDLWGENPGSFFAVCCSLVGLSERDVGSRQQSAPEKPEHF